MFAVLTFGGKCLNLKMNESNKIIKYVSIAANKTCERIKLRELMPVYSST